MIAKKICLALLLLSSAVAAYAETPASMVASYTAEAAKTTPGFAASAQRGQAFFAKEWGVSQKMPNCASCHGKNLKAEGKHVITDKRIDPLSPAATPGRFTDVKKTEKWFKRNCTEVTGRECTPAEKADFIQFVSQGA